MHEIYGERFISRETPAWHGLGTTFTEPLTATEAVEAAGIDYRVEKQPHEVWVDEVLVTTLYDLIRMPNEQDPSPAYFGTVSENYEVIDNTVIASALDPLTSQWPVETVGALREGSSVFFTLKTGEFSIGGDEIRGYFLVHNSHTGKESLRIAFTPIRVVCNNTLTLGLKEAQVNIGISHQRGALDQLNFWTEVLPLMEVAQQRAKEVMERLAAFKLSKKQVEQVLMAAYPDPKVGTKAQLKETLQDTVIPEALMATIDKASASNEYYVNRQAGFREATKELIDIFNDTYPLTAGTAWAVTNAIAESEDWRRGREPEFASVFAGDRVRAKERGFRKAVELMK